MFQRNEDRFISLDLKIKQQKSVQLQYVFLNKFDINHYLLFPNFPDL